MHQLLRFSWSFGKFVLLSLVVSVGVIGALHFYFYHFG